MTKKFAIALILIATMTFTSSLPIHAKDNIGLINCLGYGDQSCYC